MIPIEYDLWGPKQCAEFFKCSESQFTQYIKTFPEFPAPVSIPLAKVGKAGKPMRMHDRWQAIEVVKYATTCKA